MWDRRKFMVVFLKALQVIGNIQEVLVRTGDTTILNCTCISQINGNWVGPNRSSSKTNSFNEEKLIPYTEGFRVNKKLNISNIYVVGSYENRTCNLMITKFSTDHEGKYKFQYVENHITNSHVYKVLLQRPPTNLKIENETQNNTLRVVEGSMLQLVCSVQRGKPTEILQWKTDTAVVKEGGQDGTIIYRLNASSSDHMKIFICSVFNEALDHPITKQVRLDVLGKPKVTVYFIPDGNHLQEYQEAKLCCKTEANPASTHITWFKDTQNIKILNSTRHCISFTPLRRQHNGKYTCTAMNSIGFSSATKDNRVLYHPDVSINTTESKQIVTLKCNASGDPGIYEFAEWDHQSVFGKHIRYLENTRNGTLVLEKHNYQNSGIYKCSVQNGIPDMNGELYQEKLVMVNYKGPPIFVSNNTKTWFAPYNGDFNIIVKVFSSSNITRGLIRRHNEKQSSEAIRSFVLSTCREGVLFHNVSVLVECIELTFDLIMLDNDAFGNYTVEVCNTFNCSCFKVTVISAHDDFTSTFAYGYCWIIMGSIVGGVVLLCGCLHIYCCLKRAKTCSSNIHQITPEDNYDEVETLNYNNVMFDHVPNDADMNNDNVSSINDNNDIMLRADVVDSDDSSSFKQSGDGYENPYQAINPCDIEMHHYSSIVSCNYQNTIIFPLSELAKTPKHLNIAMDSLTNPWLVIYKRK